MKRFFLTVLLFAVALVANAQLQDSGWAKNRGNSLNSGLSLGSGAFNFTKWVFTTQVAKNFIKSPVVDVNGNVYLAATDGSTYCLNGATGAIIWTATTGPVSLSCPAISTNGNLYVGNDLGLFYSIVAATGEINWVVKPNSTAPLSLGPPTIGSDGTLYVTSNDGNLYAINPDSGNTEWTLALPGSTGYGAYGCPAISSNGTLYVGGGSTLYVLDKSGNTEWTFPILTGVFFSPAIGSDGTVYVGSSSGPVYALNGKTGLVIWTFLTGGLYSSPALGPDGTVYMASSDANLYALNGSTGLLNWEFTSPTQLYWTPAIGSDGTVYLPSAQTYLYAVNGKTGNLDWQFATSGADLLEPAVGGDGSLYVPNGYGNLYAFPAGVVPVGLLLTPPTVVGGSYSTATVTLNKPATTAITVSISSSLGGLQIPTSIKIPAGQTIGTFIIGTPYVVANFQSKISVTAVGVTQSAILNITPLALTGLTIAPGTVTGGASATATVTMNYVAPAGGEVVSVGSDNNAVTPPGAVTIPAGQSTITFQIPTVPVTAPAYSVVTATLNGASPQKAFLTVNPAELISITLNPSVVGGGASSTGTLTLSGVAPPTGLTATLSNSNSAAGIPGTVKIPGGASVATFTVHTAVVTKPTTAIIVATVGTVTHAASLTINPAYIASITLNPATLVGATTSTATVTLEGTAPKGGIVVKLKSSVKSATLPASITIPVGKSTGTFMIHTTAVATQTVATITGTTGSFSAEADLTINAPSLVSVTLSPAKVVGGKTSTGTVKISGAAPTGGVSVTLSCSITGATVPTKVTIPAGRTSATFTVKTVKTSSTTSATISAAMGPNTMTAALTIT